jgi:hypothetical protein
METSRLPVACFALVSFISVEHASLGSNKKVVPLTQHQVGLLGELIGMDLDKDLDVEYVGIGPVGSVQ